MNIRILQAYIGICKSMGIEPTWNGLKIFKVYYYGKGK
jgi:hypothetical protein